MVYPHLHVRHKQCRVWRQTRRIQNLSQLRQFEKSYMQNSFVTIFLTNFYKRVKMDGQDPSCFPQFFFLISWAKNSENWKVIYEGLDNLSCSKSRICFMSCISFLYVFFFFNIRLEGPKNDGNPIFPVFLIHQPLFICKQSVIFLVNPLSHYSSYYYA